ncbi:hypothetical protein HZA56_09355 [Candidatus Poribacteria bacterium]|nr:hypothetical protein [Candidatus Poribacteria bacterium]
MDLFKAIVRPVAFCLACLLAATPAFADIVCDAVHSAVNLDGTTQVDTLKTYVKSNKVKLEYQTGQNSIIIRSDLQVILSVFPSENAYSEINFEQLCTVPFGPTPLIITPGFTEPVVEFLDTGQTARINSVVCRKYVINEISSFRLLQYTVFASQEPDFPETFASFFGSGAPLKYKPFEEMRKIPGLPLKIIIIETVSGNSYVQTYEFSNYHNTSLEDSAFNLPVGYAVK